MRILIILLIIFISYNSGGYEADSSVMDKRINNAIEYIKSDSLFCNTVYDSCSSELSFCLYDSTSYPILFWSEYLKIFKNLPDSQLIKLWKEVRNSEINYKGNKPINSCFIKDELVCNYILYLMIFPSLPELYAFYVFTLKPCNKSIGIIIWLLYDKENNIIKSISRINKWSN